MNKQRVVITGFGQVSAMGFSVEAFWESVSQGRNNVTPWAPNGIDNFPVRYAATVDDAAFAEQFTNEFTHAPALERRGRFGYIAAVRALQHAGVVPGANMGIAACSGVPEIHDAEAVQLQQTGSYPAALQKFQSSAVTGFCSSNDSMAAAIARRCQAYGPVLNINGACAGAAQAIGMAYHAVRRGEVDMMLAGGADSVTNVRVMAGLYLLGATATGTSREDRLCCPFDKTRCGLVAGEGGAFLLLESEASARKRNARIYGEVLGYSCTLDAYKVTAPHPEGVGALQAMQKALADASLRQQQLDYINAHGTSTPLNDATETLAIKKLFAGCESEIPPISSTKSVIGHWISAAAAPEAMATVLALYHQLIPPTINLDNPDPECDLDYVPREARQAKMRYALSNSFGFGGINASLIFGAYHES